MYSGSGITAISEELVWAPQGQPEMTQNPLTQVFVGNARVVTSLGQERDIETQSCPLHLTIKTMLGPVWLSVPFIVLSGGGDVVIIGQKTLIENLGIDVMARLKASELKAHGCQDDSGMEFTTLAVCEPNDGAVLRAVMAVTAFGPDGGASGDVEEVTQTLLSQRPIMFQDSEVEMKDRLSALETAVDDAVDHGLRPECAIVLCDIVFGTHLDVLRRALLGAPPQRVEPMTVRLQPGASAVRAKPCVACPPTKAAWLHQHMANLETAGMVFRKPQAIYASVAMAIPK